MRTEERLLATHRAVPDKRHEQPADPVHRHTVSRVHRISVHQRAQSLIDARRGDLLVVPLDAHAEAQRREGVCDELAILDRAAQVRQTVVLVLVTCEDEEDRELFVLLW